MNSGKTEQEDEMPKAKKIRRMTNKEYVANGGGKCPYCKSHGVDVTGSIEADGTVAWCVIVCNYCGKMWQDVYQLQGYDPLPQVNDAH